MSDQKDLLNQLERDLMSLVAQMQTGGLTLLHKNVEDDGVYYFMLRHKRRDVSEYYCQKYKNYEKFHDFTVTVFAHIEPPSAAYALTYQLDSGMQIHYFKNLVQLQAHLLMYVSIEAGRAMDPVIDERISYSGPEAAKFVSLYGWPSAPTKLNPAAADPSI